MRKAGVWAQYDADVKAAWDVLTNREDVSWRTDLKKIEYRSVNDDFVEYSNDNYQTGFVITEERPYEYYEIETWSLETKGRRMYTFEETDDGKARVILQEEVKIRPIWIEWLSKFFMPQTKILSKILEDARDYIEMGPEAAKKERETGELAKEAKAQEEAEILAADPDLPDPEELKVYDTNYLSDEAEEPEISLNEAERVAEEAAEKTPEE